MRSDNVKKGSERAPNRSLFYALGYTTEELDRPLIGVVSAYSEIVPGHMNLDKLADAVKAGVEMAGGTPILIPAIGVCDGVGQFVQVHVAGHDLAVSRHHADQGAVQLFGGVAQGVKQASVGGALRAFGHVVASHRNNLLEKQSAGSGGRCVEAGVSRVVNRGRAYFFSQLIMLRS